MCGIFGFSNKVEDKNNLLKMMGNKMIHRGPDGDGYFIDNKIAMGMVRLSIIDIQKGNQPFFNRSQDVVVMCNGEIYNYLELKKELKKEGFEFKTDSDIEILPFLYEKYGIEFVKKLNGMFAIALYDKNKNLFYLIRDRLGIKPLYFTIQNDDLAYASELKSLLLTPGLDKQIDFDALSTYLDLRYIPRPLSPFKGINKLDSGSYLLWNGENISIEKYWEKLVSMCQFEHYPFEQPLHEIYKTEKCLSPIPSLAIHFTNINSIFGLSPNIDWGKIWKENENY